MKSSQAYKLSRTAFLVRSISTSNAVPVRCQADHATAPKSTTKHCRAVKVSTSSFVSAGVPRGASGDHCQSKKLSDSWIPKARCRGVDWCQTVHKRGKHSLGAHVVLHFNGPQQHSAMTSRVCLGLPVSGPAGACWLSLHTGTWTRVSQPKGQCMTLSNGMAVTLVPLTDALTLAS